MRLIKCHVVNFGTLSNFSLNFNQQLNTIYSDNGTGKSTLAAFIKAMFYGFSGQTKKNLNDNEKLKFTPWNGGNFGGSIDFSINEKEYHLERFFNSKEDAFELYDLRTNKLSLDFSSNIGIEIFGVDSEGFERSTYLPQKVLNGKNNITISAKLNDLTSDTNDISNYEKAEKKLQEFKRSLKTPNAGQIVDCQKKITLLESNLDKCEQAMIAIEQTQALCDDNEREIQNCSKEIQELEKLKERVSLAKAQNEVAEHFQTIKTDVQNCEDNLERIDSFFKGNAISDEEMKQMNSICFTISADENKNDLSSVKKEKQELERFFNDKIPTIETIDYLQKENKTKAHCGKNNIVLLVIAICLFVLGAISFIFSLVAGILGALSAIACFVIFMFSYFNQAIKMQGKNEKVEDKEITLFLLNYFDDANNAEEKLVTIRNKLIKFETIKELVNNINENQFEDLEQEKEKLTSFLSSIFGENILPYSEKLQIIENNRQQQKIYLDELNKKKKNLEEFLHSKTDVSFVDAKEDYAQVTTDEKMLKEKLKTLTSKKISFQNKINSLENVANDFEEFQSQKEEEMKNLSDLQQKYNEVVQTLSQLALAKDLLNSKYSKDMETYFIKYCSYITNDAIIPHFDSELNLSVENNGIRKSEQYYSKGYKDLFDICGRLALVDCLFKEEKPFIIFDDPFVNLDDEKLLKAKELLKKVSEKFQVIYLICHSSRK